MEKMRYKNSVSFLFPKQIIKLRQFSKRDVKQVKRNLVRSLSYIYFLVAIVFLILLTFLFITMNIESGNHIIEKYGLSGFLGMIIGGVGALACVLLIATSFFITNKKKSGLLRRIAGDLLFISLSMYMCFCIYADAEKGFAISEESLSPALIVIAVLVLIRPMYWLDAAILDFGTSLSILAVAIIAHNKFGMQALIYYIIVAVIFPLFCYLVVTLMFYAESSRYKETLENERLHDNAYYDSLTHCKNRYSLDEFLAENKSRFSSGNINLLMALFDIDDFRLYNNQFSHLGGDYCLKVLCDAIRREFSSPNLDFYRFGGEEFLLFFEVKDDYDAREHLRRIKNAIDVLDIVAPKGAPKEKVTVSIGGNLFSEEKDFVFEEEMSKVDEYLYKAKENGKDCICYNGTIINN